MSTTAAAPLDVHPFSYRSLGAAIIEQAVHDYRRLSEIDPSKQRRTSSTAQPSYLAAQEAERFLFEGNTLERVTDLFKLEIDPTRIRVALRQNSPNVGS